MNRKVKPKTIHFILLAMSFAIGFAARRGAGRDSHSLAGLAGLATKRALRFGAGSALRAPAHDPVLFPGGLLAIAMCVQNVTKES